MAEVTQELDELDAAIGCDLDENAGQLFFVEYGGKVSRLDLVRDNLGTVSEGEATISGTFQFDFDSGTESETEVDPEPHMDVFWRQETDTERELVPRHGAKIGNVGVVDFGGFSSAEVQNVDLSTEPIDGDAGDSNQLVEGDVFVVETTAGNIAKVEVLDYGYDLDIRWKTYELSDEYTVLGTGYDRPEDIVLGGDGLAFVTERGGNFLIVDLDDADRSEATELVTDFTNPHQISLDAERNRAYVVEYDDNGRLVRIDLSTGSTTTLFEGLDHAVGLAMTDDGQTAYVTEQASDGGRLTRIDLSMERRETLVEDLTAPFFLEWADEGEERLLLTERDPADELTTIDVDDRSKRVLADVPFRPSSTARSSSGTIFVCSDDEISKVDIIDGIFSSTGPMLLGVGDIPKTYVVQDTTQDDVGYADTTGAGLGLEVQDAPFGGTLRVKINHERAFEEGAEHYRLLVDTPDGDTLEPRQAFVGQRWTTSTNRFEPHTESPASGGYYDVRKPDELWYHPWMGYELDTSILRNGLHTIRVEFYEDQNRSSKIASLTDEIHLEIDNGWPVANVREIIHHLPDGSTEVVDACGIVDSRTDDFSFGITADDPEGHFRNLRLVAFWGDNEHQEIYDESYDPTRKALDWSGPGDVTVPTPPWDAVHRDCAHMFRLNVRDRVTNGRRHVHRATDRKLITLLIPG